MTSRAPRLAWPSTFLLLSALFPSCLVYDGALLSGAIPPSGTGGSATGGVAGEGDGGSGTGGEEPLGGSGSTPPETGGGEGTGGSVDDVCTWEKGEPILSTETIDLVDDFNDGNNQILVMSGRTGSWFSLNDSSGGSQFPGPGQWIGLIMQPVDGDTDQRALHYQAEGFTGTGKGDGWHLFGARLNDGAAYDLSVFSGVAFWMRVDCETPFSEQTLTRVAISDEHSEGSSGVVDHPGVTINTELSTEWTQVKVPFEDFSRRFGNTNAFSPETAIAIYFSSAVEGALDIWIDDLVFYTDN